MGQITFKENGSIQFKGGKITFLSYVPMPDPTVKVQWVYESGRYKAKATIKNNYEYDAILNYTVTLGETVESDVVTLTGLDEFTPILYDSEKSPDNGILFKVEAFIGDDNYVRPNSATISKQTTADFRRYLYNEGQDFAGMRDWAHVGNYTYTNNVNDGYIYMNTTAPQRVSGSIEVFPDSRYDDDISPLTDKKLIFDWWFISGDNDRDYLEIKYKTTTLKTYLSSFTRRENSFNISTSGAFHDINIKLCDDTSPGATPSVYIYKIYVETINNGPLVQ